MEKRGVSIVSSNEMKHPFRPLRLLLLLPALAAPILLSAATADEPAPPSQAKRAGTPSTGAPWLSPGDSWQFDRALTITFLRVLRDDRIEVPVGDRPNPERRRLHSLTSAAVRPAKSGPGRTRIRGSIAVAVRLQLGEAEPRDFRIRANSRLSTAAVIAPEPTGPDLVGIPFAWVVEIDSVRPKVSRRGRPWPQHLYRLRPRAYVAV